MKCKRFLNPSTILAFIILTLSFVRSKPEDKPLFEPQYELTHHVTFEVQTGTKPSETLVVGLYGKLVPKTVENFLAFCKGTKIDGRHYSYQNVPFHRIIPNFMIQGGDVVNKNGSGAISIYGEEFPDENFTAKHKKHVIAMANRGPNTNGSQFYITTIATSWLNGHHVVFGELVDGEYVLQAIEATGTESGNPTTQTVMLSCKVKEL